MQIGNVYFAPLAAHRLYLVPQSVLGNASATEKEIGDAVEYIGQVGSYMEGFTADDKGRAYMGTAEQNSIKYFNTSISSISNATSLKGSTAQSTKGTDHGVIPAENI